MKILGIDPGYGTLGFGIIELIDTDWEAIDFGVITTDKTLELPNRLVQIYDDMYEIIKEFKPNIIAIEELYFVQNITTGIQVAEARGVVLLAASQAELSIYEYGPNEVKSAISGYGHASKSQMQTMVQKILNLKKKPHPDDAADALAIALTCGFSIV